MWVRQSQDRATLPRADAKEVEGSLPALLREAADSFLELATAHIKLSNLELVADLEARTRQIAYQLAVCAAGLVGYGLLMVALSLAIASFMRLDLAFALVGSLHLVAAGIAAWILSRRPPHALQIERVLKSVGTSITVVTDAVLASNGDSNAKN